MVSIYSFIFVAFLEFTIRSPDVDSGVRDSSMVAIIEEQKIVFPWFQVLPLSFCRVNLNKFERKDMLTAMSTYFNSTVNTQVQPVGRWHQVPKCRLI